MSQTRDSVLKLAALSPNERRVICAIETRADWSYTKLARLAGVKVETLRRIIRRLTEQKVLAGPVPLIDIRSLNLGSYIIYLSLIGNEIALADLLKDISKQLEVSFLAKIGGEFQYALEIAGESPDLVLDMLARLSQVRGIEVTHKIVGRYLEFKTFGRKYLFPQITCHPITVFDHQKKFFNLTRADRQLLHGLANLQYTSLRDLARQLTIPESTLIRRVAALKEIGIIRGSTYRIRLDRFGIQRHRVILYARGYAHALPPAIADYCEKHPLITNFLQCIGAWDYEFSVETIDPTAIGQITSDIYGKFGKMINRIGSYPIYEVLKYSSFPVKSEE